MSPLTEEDSAFAKEAFSEITEMDIAKIDANEAVQKLIAFEGADVSSIEYGGVPIKFRVFLNKSLRHKMMRAKMQLDNAEGEDALNKTERLMYDVLGEVCTEPPWNDWKTWSRVDELI